jgi:hypothetical protein
MTTGKWRDRYLFVAIHFQSPELRYIRLPGRGELSQRDPFYDSQPCHGETWGDAEDAYLAVVAAWREENLPMQYLVLVWNLVLGIWDFDPPSPGGGALAVTSWRLPGFSLSGGYASCFRQLADGRSSRGKRAIRVLHP